MFSQLKSLVDLIKGAVEGAKKIEAERARKDEVLGLLKTYFLLKDCVDDGEVLIEDAGHDPVAKIESLDGPAAIEKLTQWDAVIRNQGQRLYLLQGYLYGQDHLTVISPDLQKQLDSIVGSKASRAVTLHGIGSALFFKSMFPINDTNEEKAKYVALMAGERGKSINMERAGAEIQDLRQSLGDYRQVIDRFLSNDEIVALLKQARQETLFRPASQVA